jgi:hypothetical protein
MRVIASNVNASSVTIRGFPAAACAPHVATCTGHNFDKKKPELNKPRGLGPRFHSSWKLKARNYFFFDLQNELTPK